MGSRMEPQRDRNSSHVLISPITALQCSWGISQVQAVAITEYFRAFPVLLWHSIRPILKIIHNSLCIRGSATSFQTFTMFLQTEHGGKATSFGLHHCKCTQCIAQLLMHKEMCIIYYANA